jgi:hypothetical protein
MMTVETCGHDALDVLHRAWAARLGEALSGYLGTVVRITVHPTRAVPASAADVATPDGVAYSVAPDPLPGRWAVWLASGLVGALVERVVGGAGGSEQPRRACTDLDLTLLETIAWEHLSAWRDAWTPVASLQPRLGDPSRTLVAAMQARPDDTVLLTRADVALLDGVHPMVIALAQASLETIADRLRDGVTPASPPAPYRPYSALPRDGVDDAREQDPPRFAALAETPPERAARVLAAEHPQTAALVLACLPSAAAARVLDALGDRAPDIAMRLGTMGPVAPETIAEVDAVLRKALARASAAAPTPARRLAAILGHVQPTTAAAIRTAIERVDPELAGDIASRRRRRPASERVGRTAATRRGPDKPRSLDRPLP